MPELINAGPSPRGWSRLGAMLQCPQKYAYTFILPEDQGGGKGAKNSPALIKGSLLHTGLAHHYRIMQARQNGEDEKQWFEPLVAMQLQALQEGEEWLEHLEDCNAALNAYIAHYGVETFYVVAVEHMISTKIGDYEVTGRADLIIQSRSDNKVYIVDHKTTSRISGSQVKSYGISGQLIGYDYMGREMFGDLWGGMILNQLQHKDPIKYNRVTLPPSPNMLVRFPQLVRDAEEMIARYSTRPVDEYPMVMNELICYHRYGACPFVDKCRWGKNA